MKKTFLILFLIFSIFFSNIYKKSEKARFLCEEKRYEEAKRIYEDILKRTKNREEKSLILFNIGTISFILNDYQNAISNFYDALNISSDDFKPRILYNLAFSLYKNNQNEEALKILRDAIELKENFLEAKILYEWILKQKKEQPPPDKNEEEEPPPEIEDLPPPPPDVFQDENLIGSKEMKPW